MKKNRPGTGLLVLGVDTCGPSGTVALARVEGTSAWILGQTELAGRSYSATLVAAVGELLAGHGTKLAEVGAIVVVHGPGSFTGVRVGLSAVKGLAEPVHLPVTAVSRLAVMAAKSGVASAALDAHRNEAFLRLAGADGDFRELLAGAEDLAKVDLQPAKVATCDDRAVTLLESVWKRTQLVWVEAPTAADAIKLCVPEILAGAFTDLALLDGHYLRRSDAEIFGDAPRPEVNPSPEIDVRRMAAADLDRVMEIALSMEHAPVWPPQAYRSALDADAQPRRLALVAEAKQSGAIVGLAVARLTPPEAELESILTAAPHQRRGVARALFSALKRDMRRCGVGEVVLEVRAGNRSAQGFYRFLGFVEEGRRPSYYADPVEDAIIMRLALG